MLFNFTDNFKTTLSTAFDTDTDTDVVLESAGNLSTTGRLYYLTLIDGTNIAKIECNFTSGTTLAVTSILSSPSEHTYPIGTDVILAPNMYNLASMHTVPIFNNKVTPGLFGSNWELDLAGNTNFFNVDFDINANTNDSIILKNIAESQITQLSSNNITSMADLSTGSNTISREVYICVRINNSTSAFGQELIAEGINGSDDTNITINGTGPDGTTRTKIIRLIVMGYEDLNIFVHAEWLPTQSINIEPNI